MSRERPARSRKGFTIVELIVAIMVLAVGILGLAATAGVVGRNMRVSYLETQLRARAQSEMERLLSTPLPQLAQGQSGQADLQVTWQVTGGNLKQILIVARQRLGEFERADTLAALVGSR
jgi:prepilin-type N-terminal cleavage/methylation domain-containing protein